MGTEWQRGSIAAPADGKVAWTTHADLAEAAAVVLTGAAVFEGPTLPLTGSESFDLADLASLGWSLVERSVDREVVDDDVFRERLVRSGMPQNIVAVTLGFYEASRRGGFAEDRRDHEGPDQAPCNATGACGRHQRSKVTRHGSLIDLLFSSRCIGSHNRACRKSTSLRKRRSSLGHSMANFDARSEHRRSTSVGCPASARRLRTAGLHE
jgi:hypothetical protein